MVRRQAQTHGIENLEQDITFVSVFHRHDSSITSGLLSRGIHRPPDSSSAMIIVEGESYLGL